MTEAWPSQRLDNSPSESLMFELEKSANGEEPCSPDVLLDRPQHALVVGKSTLSKRNYRDDRTAKSRLARFERAAIFAYKKDWPFTVFVTITWTALKQAGERNEGHSLGKSSRERDQYLRREVARLALSLDLPFVAIWGRDIGKDMGEHIHVALFWPSRRLKRLVALIARVTGSSAEIVKIPYSADLVARSVCGGWQFNMNNRDKAGALDLVSYIAGQHDKHHVPPEIRGKAFGISKAIGKAAQDRAGFLHRGE